VAWHFVALSTNAVGAVNSALHYRMPGAQTGRRLPLTSAIGLSLMIAIGLEIFTSKLQVLYAMGWLPTATAEQTRRLFWSDWPVA